MCARAERREQPPDVIIRSCTILGRGDEPGLEGVASGRSPPAARSSGCGSSAASITASINSSLSAKTLKIVPSDTPARCGDLLGGDGLAVLDDQRGDGVHDRRPPLGGGQRSRTSALGCRRAVTARIEVDATASTE